jgi:serine carboxypeptidase-like clade 4
MLFDMQYYDIRKKSGDLSYDFTKMETFLNLKIVREALGVGDLKFVSCSTIVNIAMADDWMKNLEVGIPALLEDGIKLLVYAGEYDLICNWLGKLNFLVLSHWSGREVTKIWPKIVRVRI